MTIDDVRAAADKASNWMPALACDGQSHGGPDGCSCCEGAQRAVEDIADHVDDAMRSAKNNDIHSDMHWQVAAVNSAERAARISSYFASEPNPVSEFRDTGRKFVEAGK